MPNNKESENECLLRFSPHNHYIVPIEEVKEVKETTDVRELNNLIKSGWMLLEAVTSSKEILFALGNI